jgi:hypothetical protein
MRASTHACVPGTVPASCPPSTESDHRRACWSSVGARNADSLPLCRAGGCMPVGLRFGGSVLPVPGWWHRGVMVAVRVLAVTAVAVVAAGCAGGSRAPVSPGSAGGGPLRAAVVDLPGGAAGSLVGGDGVSPAGPGEDGRSVWADGHRPGEVIAVGGPVHPEVRPSPGPTPGPSDRCHLTPRLRRVQPWWPAPARAPRPSARLSA